MNFEQVTPGLIPGFDFKTLDALFVDLDDTLVDYRIPCRLGLQEIAKLVPGIRKVGIDTLEADFHGILRDNLPKIFDNEITVEKERLLRLDAVLRRYGKRAEKFELSFYDELFQHVFWSNRRPSTGAIEFLELCESVGIPVVAISNGNREIQERTLIETGIGDYIDTMLIPSNSGELKPGAAMFEKALEMTGAKRDNTIMIGDSWKYDVAGAINSGITPIWINSSGSGVPSGSDVQWAYDIGEIARLWKRQW